MIGKKILELLDVHAEAAETAKAKDNIMLVACNKNTVEKLEAESEVLSTDNSLLSQFFRFPCHRFITEGTTILVFEHDYLPDDEVYELNVTM